MNWYHFLIPSVAELITTNPLDSLKTRRQADRPFSLVRHSFRGFGYRAVGFLPVRTSFWWAQHNSPFHDIWKKAWFVTTIKSTFDIPLDYWKTRHVNEISQKNHWKLNAASFGFHYMRNYIFCISLLSTRDWTSRYMTLETATNNLVGIGLGSALGVLAS
jgi:hypothetical protein